MRTIVCGNLLPGNQIQWETIISSVVVFKAGLRNNLVAQSLINVIRHRSFRFELAQSCPMAGKIRLIVVVRNPFNVIDVVTCAVYRAEIDIHKCRRGERPRAGDGHIRIRHGELGVGVIREVNTIRQCPAVERPKAGAAFVHAGHTGLIRVKQCDGGCLRIRCGILRNRNIFRGWVREFIRYSMVLPLSDVDAEIIVAANFDSQDYITFLMLLGNSYLIFRISLNGDGDCRAVAGCLIAHQVNTCDISGSDFLFWEIQSIVIFPI